MSKWLDEFLKDIQNQIKSLEEENLHPKYILLSPGNYLKLMSTVSTCLEKNIYLDDKLYDLCIVVSPFCFNKVLPEANEAAFLYL